MDPFNIFGVLRGECRHSWINFYSDEQTTTNIIFTFDPIAKEKIHYP